MQYATVRLNQISVPIKHFGSYLTVSHPTCQTRKEESNWIKLTLMRNSVVSQPNTEVRW